MNESGCTTRHDEVIIAVKKHLSTNLLNDPKNVDDILVVRKISNKRRINLACTYDLPNASLYNWNEEKHLQVCDLIKSRSKKNITTTITGNINLLSCLHWKAMTSSDADKNNCLKFYLEENIEKALIFSDVLGNSKQLDVFLMNAPHFWIHSITIIETNSGHLFNMNKKNVLKIWPIQQSSKYNKWEIQKSNNKYAHCRTDWVQFNQSD